MGQAVISGLIGGWLSTLFLGWAVHNARSVAADRQGWRTIRAGAGVWTPLAGAAGFSLLLFYVYFFVGSARADAERQMMYCLGLAVTFAVGSLALAWSACSRSVAWRDGELRVRPLLGTPVTKRLGDLASIEYRSWSSMFRLTFSDGYVVELSPYMQGTQQLLDEVGAEQPG
jgi:hypothetical protein